MSILDGLVEPELRARARLEISADCATVYVDTEARNIEISLTHPEEDVSRFDVWCVRPPTTAEAGVRSLKDRSSGGRTLGYIFPITSFSPGSDFCAARLQSQFEKIFSSVAVKALLERGSANRWLTHGFADLLPSTPIPDLFSGDLALVVVGRENMAECGLSNPAVKLLIQEAGYFPADLSSEYFWSRVKPEVMADNCSIGRVSADLDAQSDLIGTLICLASQQTSAVASLLIYYQVVEAVSERVLFERLRRLAASTPRDAWEFKEALGKAASERSRIVAICTQAAADTDVAIFRSLRDSGIDLLRSAGEAIEDDADPGAVLYRVRNLVVHKQTGIPPTSYPILGSFVALVHGAVFAILRRFALGTVG
jgi:hypothetical protein